LLIGNKVNIFLWANVLKTIVGPLDKRTARAQQIKKLFWIMGPAFRPESAADTASHYSYIVVMDAHFLVKR
jgi:hypothetical protein